MDWLTLKLCIQSKWIEISRFQCFWSFAYHINMTPKRRTLLLTWLVKGPRPFSSSTVYEWETIGEISNTSHTSLHFCRSVTEQYASWHVFCGRNQWLVPCKISHITCQILLTIWRCFVFSDSYELPQDSSNISNDIFHFLWSPYKYLYIHFDWCRHWYFLFSLLWVSLRVT